MTTTVSHATIAIAESFLGLAESDPRIRALFTDGIPKYWQWAVPPDNNGEPPDWCASFVSQCIRMGMGLDLSRWGRAGFAPRDSHHPFKRWLVGVPQLVKWADARDAWVDEPSRGMVFIEYRRARPVHTGFVRGAYPHLAFSTIEGNLGDKVASRTIHLEDRTAPLPNGLWPAKQGDKSYRFFNPFTK